MGRVGEDVVEWESGEVGWGGVGWRGRRRRRRKEEDGERWGWNGVCVYDCTDVNKYTRFTNEKSESFFVRGKRAKGLLQDFFQLISCIFDIGISRSWELAHLIQPQLS